MAEEFKIIQMKNSAGVNVFPKTMAELVKFDETTSVKAKLEALDASSLTAVKWNGEAFTVTDKAVDIYSKVSSFVSQEIGKQIHMNVEVVDSLPATGVAGTIYLVAEEDGLSDGNFNVYVEYIWTGEKFERIGTTKTDLTDYATKEFVGTEIGKKVTELGLDKLDKTFAPIALVGRVEAIEAKVPGYDAYVAVERYSKTEADAMAEGKASAAIEALDLPNTYAAKGATEQHIANTDIHVTTDDKTRWDGKQDALSAEQLAAIADVANKANAADVYTKGEAETMAEGKASAAIEALDLPNTYAAKAATEQHIADGDIHVTAAQKEEWSGKQDAIENVANIVYKDAEGYLIDEAGTKLTNILYFEEVTA